MKLVVGMTGATGAAIGVRVLTALRDLGVETHLIISKWARATIQMETPYSVQDVSALAAKTTANTTRLPPFPAVHSASTA